MTVGWFTRFTWADRDKIQFILDKVIRNEQKIEEMRKRMAKTLDDLKVELDKLVANVDKVGVDVHQGFVDLQKKIDGLSVPLDVQPLFDVVSVVNDKLGVVDAEALTHVDPV